MKFKGQWQDLHYSDIFLAMIFKPACDMALAFYRDAAELIDTWLLKPNIMRQPARAA